MMLLIFVRSLVFNVFMVVWTLLVAILCVPVWLFGNLYQVGHVGTLWGRGLIVALRLCCGITHQMRGLEHVTGRAVIIAAKHQSAWETMALLATLPRPVYVLKQELTRIPFYGPYLTRMGMIAIDRQAGASALKTMVRQAAARIAEGRSVIIFPEGTRGKPGERRPYHPGIAALYKSSHIHAPVVPVALNSGLFWGKSSFIKKPGVITLECLPPIPEGLSREAFMERLEREVEEASERLRQEGMLMLQK